MIVNFYNNSNSTVVLKTIEAGNISISPHENRRVLLAEHEYIEMRLNENSYVEKGKYFLNSNYKFCLKNSATSNNYNINVIQCELQYNIKYNIIYVSENEQVIRGNWNINNSEILKRQYLFKRIFHTLILDLFEYIPLLLLIYAIIAVPILLWFQWKILAIYLLLGYILMILISQFSQKLGNVIGKKITDYIAGDEIDSQIYERYSMFKRVFSTETIEKALYQTINDDK